MAHIGAHAQTFEEAAGAAFGAAVFPERGDEFDQPFGEAGQLIGRQLLETADIQPDLENRPVGPDIRPAQHADALDLHTRLLWAAATEAARRIDRIARP